MSFSTNQRITIFLAILLFSLISFPVSADVILGSDARAIAMGGAGIASGESAIMNPAALADNPFRFGVRWPTIDLRMDGAGLGDTIALFGISSIDSEKAVSLARELGTKDREMYASARFGVLLPLSDLQFEAAARTNIIPNDSFKTWAAGGGTGLPPADAQADIYAGGISALPSIGAGIKLPFVADKIGTVAIGVRARPTTVYYSHYIVDSATLISGQARPAEEMGGDEYRSETSLSADAGLIYRPAMLPKLRLAFVVNNIIEPKQITLDDLAPVDLYRQQLAPRSMSAGAAYVTNFITVAADMVDLTEVFGKTELRVGTELRLSGKKFALRGGYNSLSGYTAGLGIGDFGIAMSKESPLLLSQALHF